MGNENKRKRVIRMHGEKTIDVAIKSPDELIKVAMREVDAFVIDGIKTLGGVAGENDTDIKAFELFHPDTEETFVTIIPDNTGFVFLTNYRGRDISGHVNKAISDDIDFETLINSMDEMLVGEKELNVHEVRNLINTDYSGSTKKFDIDSYKLQNVFINDLVLVLSVIVNLKPFA